MKRFLTAATLVIVLCLSVAGGQTAPPRPPTAKLLCVYDGRCVSYDCVQEYVGGFIQDLRDTEGTFALCVRSDRPLPLALANANLRLTGISRMISELYGLTNPVLFLRRKSGVVALPKAPSFPRDVIFREPIESGEPTELWFIPKGAALPSHTEAVTPNRFHVEELDDKLPVSKRLRMLADRLRERPAYGVVWRFFGDEKKPSVKNLQRQMNAALARAGISTDRALVSPYSVDFVKARTGIFIVEILPE